MPQLRIQDRLVGPNHPTYFIADIAANHDGDISRARDLIHLAKEAGADAAKFQHFQAGKIVSDYGFSRLSGQLSHQKAWKKSVFQVYAEAALPYAWTQSLKQACDDAAIHFFSTPYDQDAVDLLAPLVPAFKIGSGDIAWEEMLASVAQTGKPVLLATGAADIGEVTRAVAALLARNSQLVLMQCNTNYTGSLENFRHVHLNVLKTYAQLYPELVLGLSDHTPGHAAVLGAVALGARVVEKHFTDDKTRQGPDHGFSMDPGSWREMVARTRELELALGHALKQVEPNESDTVVVQRRCIRAARAIPRGQAIAREDLAILRPAPKGSIEPWQVRDVTGLRAARDFAAGEHLEWTGLTRAEDPA